MWQAQIFTLYPEVFPGPLSKGLYGKALINKIWNLKVVNIRDAADDKHRITAVEVLLHGRFELGNAGYAKIRPKDNGKRGDKQKQ